MYVNLIWKSSKVIESGIYKLEENTEIFPVCHLVLLEFKLEVKDEWIVDDLLHKFYADSGSRTGLNRLQAS